MPDHNQSQERPPPVEPQKRPHYPPPNEAFMVLVLALASSLIMGTLLLELGKAGAILIELLFIIPPLIYLQAKGYSIKRCLRWNRVPAVQIFTALVIGLGLIVLLDEADRLINLFFPMPPEAVEALTEFMKMDSWSDYFFIWTGAVFAAAICEESLFRGFIQLSMEAYSNVTRAVLFSALLFSLAHFNPWWLVQILVLGVFLGFVSWRANSSIPAIFIHGLNNGLALATKGIFEEGAWSWYSLGDHVSPTVLIAAMALLFIGVKLFIRQTERSFAESPAENEASPS